MKKLLLALQFSPDDQKQAHALARLIADILPAHSPHADFLFYARYDCAHDAETQKYVAKKFSTTHAHRSRRPIKGWPTGPNAMVMDLFILSHEKHSAGQWDYAAIMLLEADCIPLRASWIEEIHREWHEQKQLLLGCWVGAKNEIHKSHMNGNLLFSPRLTFTFPFLRAKTTPVSAWDVHFWKYWQGSARASRLIYSDYRVPFSNCDELWRPRVYEKGSALGACQVQPAWLHGCKDQRAMECARERMIVKTALTL